MISKPLNSLVSIIIPCFNGAAYIRQAIESAINQTYSYTDIIVVDDGSTDESLDIIQSYGDRIQVETGPNRGAQAARNCGIQLARGEFIKFLDADDVLLHDCLERQVEQTISLPNNSKAIVYGDAIWVDESGCTLPGYPHRPRRMDEDPLVHILQQSPLTSCPLHKREYLLQINGFDTSLPRGQENDLHLRLVLDGVNFVHYPGAVYCYRQHFQPGRITNRKYLQDGAVTMLNGLRRQVEMIEQQLGRPLTLELRGILARQCWAYGRAVLREGCVLEAEQYFATACKMDAKNCVVGSPPYLALVKLVGPRYAELIVQGVRHVL
jgi:glycosyltransferase involved in cell wall biosynthesis